LANIHFDLTNYEFFQLELYETVTQLDFEVIEI